MSINHEIIDLSYSNNTVKGSGNDKFNDIGFVIIIIGSTVSTVFGKILSDVAIFDWEGSDYIIVS